MNFKLALLFLLSALFIVMGHADSVLEGLYLKEEGDIREFPRNRIASQLFSCLQQGRSQRDAGDCPPEYQL